MTAYVMINVEVKNPEEYKGYALLAKPTVELYGGRYIARGGRAETLEGQVAAQRMVLLEFPDYDTAKAWWASEEYREAKAIRQANAHSEMILVEGA